MQGRKKSYIITIKRQIKKRNLKQNKCWPDKNFFYWFTVLWQLYIFLSPCSSFSYVLFFYCNKKTLYYVAKMYSNKTVLVKASQILTAMMIINVAPCKDKLFQFKLSFLFFFSLKKVLTDLLCLLNLITLMLV